MEENKNLKIGGQAVIEGVMMRSPLYYAIAVRNPQGEILVKTEEVNSVAVKHVLLKKFLLRGIVALVESLVIGFKALNYSADIQIAELGSKSKRQNNTWLWVSTFGLALLFGMGLFVALPYYLTAKVISYGLLFNMLDGVIRIIIFILYIFVISSMKDIKTIFQYHGAEHKVVFACEAGEELSVANARKYSTLHPRCGTAFLLVVMIVGIIVFSLIPINKSWPKIYQTLMKVGIRVVFIPLIAGLSYEIIKWADKKRSKFTGWLIAPGLWLQKLTTKEPTDQQLEVAIAALKEVLVKENFRHREADDSIEVVP